jgi:CheY-like chemotaxis protein
MSAIKAALHYPSLITHVVGANNYSWVYFQQGHKKLLSKPLSFYQLELPGFIRPHKTVLINPVYVKSLHRPAHPKMAGAIRLESGQSFPVSRRRWSQVVEALSNRVSVVDPVGAQPPYLPRIPQAPQAPGLSLLLVTDNEDTAWVMAQHVDERMATYSFASRPQSHDLPDRWGMAPEAELPAVLLLDARTQTQERMHTLHRLKQHPSLCWLPILLLVLGDDQLVLAGYEHQANSVISLQPGVLSIVPVLGRICRYWLTLAALPPVVPKP